MNKVIGAVLASCVLSTSAFAWNGNTQGKISNIQLGVNGGFHFWLVGAPDLCGASGLTGAKHVADVLPGQITTGGTVTAEGVRSFLSTVTAAKLAGKTVRVFVDNSGSWGCKVGAIEIID